MDQLALVAGLTGVMRWLVDRDQRPAGAAAPGLAAAAGGLLMLWLATREGLVGSLLTAPFVLIGSGVLAWVIMGNSESWTRRTLQPVALGGLALMLAAAFL